MRWRLSFTLWAAMLAAGQFPAVVAPAQQPDPNNPQVDNKIVTKTAPFLVAAEVNKPNRDYREGDSFSLRVASEEDAYLYVLYQQADGKVFQVFPNKYQPNNKVSARQAVRVPAVEDTFRWVIGPPFGKEVVKVIASKSQVDVLSSPELRSQRFNQVSKQSLKGIELEIGDEPPSQWSETDVEIHTYARNDVAADRGVRRFGVFFGVSKHLYRDEILASVYDETDDNAKRSEKQRKVDPDLYACHRDAQKLGDALSTIGRLNNYKVYTNEDATRAQLEYAITQWLPSISRPGDTVFIAYSGHTGQVEDREGDEQDKLDEYLVPTDFVDYSVLNGMQLLEKEGEYSQSRQQSLHKWLEVAQGAGGGPQGGYALIQQTCVTDDLLARWLQRLAGRQIVLLMDTCHSAGYAEQENAPEGSRAWKPILVGDSELGRLRDLGQKDQVLLASCLAPQSAPEFWDKSFGVMTYFLVDQLQNSRGSVKLEDTYEYCKTHMKQYFEELNAVLTKNGNPTVAPTQPFMLNYATEPVVFKP